MNIEKIKSFFQNDAKNYFNQYFIDVVKNQYTDFNGRATRPQYWYFVLCSVIISIPLIIIDAILFQTQVLSLLWNLAILVPGIAIGVRRLHDINKSGWFYLIALIPVAGPIALLVMFCMKSVNTGNHFNATNKKAA